MADKIHLSNGKIYLRQKVNIKYMQSCWLTIHCLFVKKLIMEKVLLAKIPLRDGLKTVETKMFSSLRF